MLKHDYSQLPVMQSDYDVKGAISWATIGKRLALGLSCTFVRDCMEPHREVSSEAPLLTVIDEVIKYEYVLIRDKTNKISGIVTTSDLGKQFRDLSEPFLLLSEIENHIRKMIDGKYTKAEIESARDPSDRQRPIVTVSDLTFGEYVRLLSNEERWRTLNLKIDRKRFVAMLDNIREIRNNIMHFDPDGISDDLIEDLREFSAMLHTLREMKAI